MKKGRAEKVCGRRNWKQRWFELDRQYLSFYDDFDCKTGTTTNMKERIDVIGAEITPTSHHNKSFTFMVHAMQEGTPLQLQAPDFPTFNCKYNWSTFSLSTVEIIMCICLFSVVEGAASCSFWESTVQA